MTDLGGRKFWLSLLGMLLATVRPESSQEVAAIVLTFCGANAAVSVAYAKRDEPPTAPRLAATEPSAYVDDERDA